jgi:hypothetical protein
MKILKSYISSCICQVNAEFRHGNRKHRKPSSFLSVQNIIKGDFLTSLRYNFGNFGIEKEARSGEKEQSRIYRIYDKTAWIQMGVSSQEL